VCARARVGIKNRFCITRLANRPFFRRSKSRGDPNVVPVLTDSRYGFPFLHKPIFCSRRVSASVAYKLFRKSVSPENRWKLSRELSVRPGLLLVFTRLIPSPSHTHTHPHTPTAVTNNSIIRSRGMCTFISSVDRPGRVCGPRARRDWSSIYASDTYEDTPNIDLGFTRGTRENFRLIRQKRFGRWPLRSY